MPYLSVNFIEISNIRHQRGYVFHFACRPPHLLEGLIQERAPVVETGYGILLDQLQYSLFVSDYFFLEPDNSVRNIYPRYELMLAEGLEHEIVRSCIDVFR